MTAFEITSPDYLFYISYFSDKINPRSFFSFLASGIQKSQFFFFISVANMQQEWTFSKN